jgi:hypothetical protein
MRISLMPFLRLPLHDVSHFVDRQLAALKLGEFDRAGCPVNCINVLDSFLQFKYVRQWSSPSRRFLPMPIVSSIMNVIKLDPGTDLGECEMFHSSFRSAIQSRGSQAGSRERSLILSNGVLVNTVAGKLTKPTSLLIQKGES